MEPIRVGPVFETSKGNKCRDINAISLLTRNPIRHSYFAVGAVTHYLSHMKLKNLTKKIRRLETRLKKDAKKLAKLKRKHAAAKTAGAAKIKGKSRSSAGKARKTATASAGAPSAAKKVRRKLNLTPERRAQLAASMKARWAAKKAAAATNQQASQPQ
jgi:hypothetical protein